MVPGLLIPRVIIIAVFVTPPAVMALFVAADLLAAFVAAAVEEVVGGGGERATVRWGGVEDGGWHCSQNERHEDEEVGVHRCSGCWRGGGVGELREVRERG
jgi:hypothetical protein